MMKARAALLFSGIIILSIFLAFWKLDQVDLEASEDIYVADAVGYLRGDLFMVPRQHLRKPHAPASPHPFLVPFLSAELMKRFGLSLVSARYLQAGATVVTVGIIMLLTYRMFGSISIAVASGLIFITTPLAVRFGRMAILDPILSLLLAMGMLWSWEVRRGGKVGLVYASFIGLSLGLSISTKLSGVFYFLPIGLVFIWLFFKKRNFYFLWVFILSLITMAFVFILFNDPYSYIYGWTHFSDPKSQNVGLMAIAKGIVAYHYWYLFVTTLTGLPIIMLLVNSIIRYSNRFWINFSKFFLFAWVLGPLSYLILNPPHITGLSAEWAYVPLFVPLSIIAGYSFIDLWNTFSPKIMRQQILIAFVGYFLVTLIPLYWYGLRFRPLPLAAYRSARNVVNGDLAVTKTITLLNSDPRPIKLLVVLKSVGFPLWFLNNNVLSEPMYHQLTWYDYVVTDNLDLVEKVKIEKLILVSSEKNPTEDTVYLFKNLHIPSK